MSDDSSIDGFRFAGLASGIKFDGALDLGLIAADEPVATAAVFTQNRVRAAPVELAAGRVERGRAQALLVNSGCANACTGKAGDDAARSTTAVVARELRSDAALVLPASTGPIGVPLPAERIESRATELVDALRPEGVDDFAQAILTTDKGPKVARRTLSVGGGVEVKILGIAKGAGMIHPQLATTLGFVLTDAPMHSSFLTRALRTATDRTFNCLSVDGDTSTNDVVFAMASGRAEAESIHGSDRDARTFIDAMTAVLNELGTMIVEDGEGTTHVVEVRVSEAPSEAAARLVAGRIATSMLVKTALFGRDPNWGRIVAAAGTAGVAFDPKKIEVRFGDAIVARKGVGAGRAAEAQAREVMSEPRYAIEVRLGAGQAKGHYLMCDLGHAYVDVNASYRS
jgi:glutamate N-acetyltransferase/amino-acid N-acetyltransferase